MDYTLEDYALEFKKASDALVELCGSGKKFPDSILFLLREAHEKLSDLAHKAYRDFDRKNTMEIRECFY